METSYLKTLELDKIIARAAEGCVCKEARAMLLAIEPQCDPDEVRYALEQTDAINTLLIKNGSPRFGGVEGVSQLAARAVKGGVLSMGELLMVAGALRNFQHLTSWYGSSEHDALPTDDLFYALAPEPGLEQQISSAILAPDAMADTASRTLAELRKKIRATENSIRDRLESMVRNMDTSKYLQESVVSMRNGRYVVPVKSEYRGEVSGIIHDVSSTGATVFVEPQAVVEANARILQYRAQEAQEIERILVAFTAQVAAIEPQFQYSYKAMLEIDILLAKARLALELKAFKPAVRTDSSFNLIRARHPLIDPQKCVPVDIALGGEYDSLIITGPNTGGKTVALKTCGLLTLMAMSGMLIPAAEGSQISVFDHVLADIGDTQSIEQNLSTFSAHMRSVIDILEQANDRSLVLLDELGSGTDPIEGAALAEAVIQRLKDNGAKLMVTTHYQELKLYATEQPDVLNASCEFDIETLRPTYRLILGSPGKSNAFAICKGLGLSDDIISQAETLVSQENLRFEEAVSKLEETRKALEHDRSAMQQALHQAEEDAAKLREEVQRTRTDRENVMEQARLEAMRIVETTKAQSNEMITELDQLRRAKEKASFGDDVIRAKGNVKRGFRKMYETANPLTEVPDEEYVLPRELQVGDTVMMADTKQKAVVAGKPDKNGTVFLQIGAMRTKVPQEKLRLVAGVEEKKKSQQKQRQTAGRVSAQAARRGTMELDIRGCTCDEGVYQMDAFLDRAVMSHIATVTIIHGKGTGLLRKAIHQRLKQLKYVKNFRLGTFGEGEDGVTIVSLE